MKLRLMVRTANRFKTNGLTLITLSVSLLAASPIPRELQRLPALEGAPGGNLLVSVNSDPVTFNRLMAADLPSGTIADRLSADLVHINRSTFELEPALASRWELDSDQRTYTLHLRQGLKFSDGSSFSADDVLFTLEVLKDPKVGSTLSDMIQVDGVFPEVTKIDDKTVRIRFPRPVGIGLRGFDSISILPKTRLQKAYQNGEFPRAWDASTPPSEIAGMGPFRLREYQRGIRVVLERNPHYWKKDKAGRSLPYLDTVTFLIIPDRNSEALRFQAGDLHLLQSLDSENYARLRRTQGDGRNVVANLGPGLQFNFLWFNLNPGADSAGKLFVDPVKRSVFEKSAFRRAVSCAIDRKAIARSLLLNLGTAQYGPLSPGNKAWLNTSLAPQDCSVAKSRDMLASLGLKDLDGDGFLNLEPRRQVEFTLSVPRGDPRRERMAQVIREDLRKAGIRMEIQLLEVRDLVVRIRKSFFYEAILFGFTPLDVAPDTLADVWLSSGANHFWHPNQKEPTRPWEREIDVLVHRLTRTVEPAERKKLFDRVQEIWVQEMPAIPTVSPDVLVAWKSDLRNIRPSILAPQLWWNIEELAFRSR